MEKKDSVKLYLAPTVSELASFLGALRLEGEPVLAEQDGAPAARKPAEKAEQRVHIGRDVDIDLHGPPFCRARLRGGPGRMVIFFSIA